MERALGGLWSLTTAMSTGVLGTGELGQPVDGASLSMGASSRIAVGKLSGGGGQVGAGPGRDHTLRSRRESGTL